MEKAKIKTRYDSSVDIFYMLFKEGPSHELVDAGPDIIIELDENGEIMGIEIWNARKKWSNREYIKYFERSGSSRRMKWKFHVN